MVKFTTTVNSTGVSISPIRICTVMLFLGLGRSFDADKGDVCTSSDTLANSSVFSRSLK